MCYCVYILFSTISLKTCSSKLARKTFEFRNLFPSREKKNVYFDSLQTAAIEILNISCCAKSPPTTRIVCMKNNDDGATEMWLVVFGEHCWVSESRESHGQHDGTQTAVYQCFLFVLVTGMSFHYYHLGVIELAALQKRESEEDKESMPHVFHQDVSNVQHWTSSAQTANTSTITQTNIVSDCWMI